MFRHTSAALLIAVSLTSMMLAATASVSLASAVVGNPDVFCGYYDDNGTTRCGGVCPFQGQYCTVGFLIKPDQPAQAYCGCFDEPDPEEPISVSS